MLVSAVQQCKSVITIYVYHLPLEPPSTPHLTPLGRNRGPGWSPCVIQKLLTRYLFYAWYYIYMSMLLSPFIPLFPSPHCVHSLFSISPSPFFSADRFIDTIFLDSTCMHSYTAFIFLFATYFTLYNRP